MIIADINTAVLFFMSRFTGLARCLSLLLFLQLCISCSFIPTTGKRYAELFGIPGGDDNHLLDMAPVFLVHAPDKPYNRIGTPQVTADRHGSPHINVNPDQSTIFMRENQFSSLNDNTYTNLIYRLHFEKVPFGFGNLHLSTGKNPGLFVVLTLNRNKDLLLITTVHTCGCHLAFLPTDSLPPEALPKNWPAAYQKVYGKKLPAIIRTPGENEKILLTLDSGSHRVSNIEIKNTAIFGKIYAWNTMKALPMESLRHLPFANGYVSFFETHGRRKGFVKNNSKPLERLLMSWWTLDWYIGQDKALGENEETDTIFYTSLKFWRRKDSDMRDFAGFLLYWGWNL